VDPGRTRVLDGANAPRRLSSGPQRFLRCGNIRTLFLNGLFVEMLAGVPASGTGTDLQMVGAFTILIVRIDETCPGLHPVQVLPPACSLHILGGFHMALHRLVSNGFCGLLRDLV